MTTESTTPTLEPTTGPAQRAWRVARSSDGFLPAVGAVVVGQIALLSVLIAQGWYYQADFSNLADGRVPLSFHYLTESQGGHLAIGDRLLYWLLYRLAPLSHAAIAIGCIVLQAAATLLLARLLTMLVGRRRGVIGVLALFASSPLLVQTSLWATASVAFLPAQLLTLLALLAHVDYAVSRRLSRAVAVALYLFAATLFSEQSAIIVLAFPVLSLAFLSSGSWSQRLRALLRAWPEWVIIALPMVAFLAYFFGSGHIVQDGSTGIGFGDATRVVLVELGASIAPGMIGGPVAWYGAPGNFLLLAAPPGWLQVLAIAAVFGLIAYTIRRSGWRAVVAWSIPLVVTVAGILVVAVGRFRGLGMIIARQLEHSGYATVPLALALALALWPVQPDAVAARYARDRPFDDVPPPVGKRSGRIAAVLVVAVVATSLVSQVGYADRWSDSPAERFVATLDAGLRDLPSNASLYDTPVDPTIIPLISPHHYVSDLADLLGRSPQFDVGRAPRIVRADGTIGEARWLAAARGLQPRGRGCAVIIRGLGDWTVKLDRAPHESEYFLRFAYLQSRASVVRITIRDADGSILQPAGGSRVELHGKLSSMITRLPLGSPAAILVHSGSLATNLCLSSVTVGAPFAVRR